MMVQWLQLRNVSANAAENYRQRGPALQLSWSEISAADHSSLCSKMHGRRKAATSLSCQAANAQGLRNENSGSTSIKTQPQSRSA